MAIQQKPIFRDPVASSQAAMAALGVGLLLDGYALWFILTTESGMLLPKQPWATLHLAVRLATLITLVMWSDRIYANITALGEIADHDRIWASVAWIIPPFCFFRPPQLVLEASRAGAEAPTPSLTKLIVTWWVLLLVPPFVLVSSWGIDLAERGRYVGTMHLFNVLAGGAAIYVLHTVSAIQKQRYGQQVRAAAAEAKRAKLLALQTLAAQPELAPHPFVPEHSMRPQPAPGIAYPPTAPAELSPRPWPARPSVPVRKPARRLRWSELVQQWEISTWRAAGAWVAVVVAIATIAAGALAAVAGETPATMIRGAMHLWSGLLLATSFLAIRRAHSSDAPDHAGRWAVIVAVIAFTAVMNLIALAGAVRG